MELWRLSFNSMVNSATSQVDRDFYDLQFQPAEHEAESSQITPSKSQNSALGLILSLLMENKQLLSPFHCIFLLTIHLKRSVTV